MYTLNNTHIDTCMCSDYTSTTREALLAYAIEFVLDASSSCTSSSISRGSSRMCTSSMTSV